MMLIRFFKKNKIGISVIVASIAMKMMIIHFGLPLLFHPDEIYIYKDPFKLLLNYKNLDFSFSTNLYFWALQVWYMIVFLIGLITNQWDNFQHFQHFLVVEDWKIIYSGRIFSSLLASIGNYFLYQLICRITKDQWLRILFILTILFNPIELISNMWLKFDPACYLFAAILMLYTYQYFAEEKKEVRNKLYFLAILGLTVRIDLIVIPASIFAMDIIKNYQKADLNFFKTLAFPILKGVLSYCIITLIPITILYRIFNNADNELLIYATFEESIANRIMKIISNFNFTRFTSYVYFYLWDCFIITMGPMTITLMLIYYKKIGSYMIYLLPALLLIPVLLLVDTTFYIAHYFLLLSEIFSIISFIIVAKMRNIKIARTLSIISLLYISSITAQAINLINSTEDPRLRARMYLLSQTNKDDIIAMIDYMPGACPPIAECKETLLSKHKISQELGKGSGKSLLEMAESANKDDCRNILDIPSDEGRYTSSIYKGKWTYSFEDTTGFQTRKPKFIVFQDETQYSGNNSMSKYIHDHYLIDKFFDINFTDTRLTILKTERIFSKVIIFKRKS